MAGPRRLDLPQEKMVRRILPAGYLGHVRVAEVLVAVATRNNE